MKKFLLSMLALASLCCVASAQDTITLKNGEKIEGCVKKDNFPGGNLFYTTSKNGETESRFVPIESIEYVSIAADSCDYVLRSHMLDIPSEYEYMLERLKPRSLRTAPLRRHVVSLEVGVNWAGRNAASPMVTAQYLYFPKSKRGVGVMVDYTFEKPEFPKSPITTASEPTSKISLDDTFYIGALFSPRTYLNNSNTFLFTDVSAGYVCAKINRYKPVLGPGGPGVLGDYYSVVGYTRSKETMSGAKIILRIGGESLLGHNSSWAVSYGAGCHFVWLDGPGGFSMLLFAGVRFGVGK